MYGGMSYQLAIITLGHLHFSENQRKVDRMKKVFHASVLLLHEILNEIFTFENGQIYRRLYEFADCDAGCYQEGFVDSEWLRFWNFDDFWRKHFFFYCPYPECSISNFSLLVV